MPKVLTRNQLCSGAAVLYLSALCPIVKLNMQIAQAMNASAEI